MVDIKKNCFIVLVLLLLIPRSTYSQTYFVSSNLPIVTIYTDSLEIEDEDRIVAYMGIIDNGPGQRNNILDRHNNYSGKINIEYRGSTSQIHPKKSYSIETQDDQGDALNVSLLDLPEENDWVLYAPYSDKSLIRNILSYGLSREMGHYAPRTKLCELVLNGEYRGVYVLIEKIKRDKNRLDIAKLKPDEISGDDLSGGYILKIDKLTGNSGEYWGTNRYGIFFQYEYPKYDEIVPEQEAYILNYLNRFEDALASDQFSDPDNGYRQYLNDTSFMDFFIANEISKNVDGYILSIYLYKDKESNGGKLSMGPVWDFNLSFGNADIREGYRTEGLQVKINQPPWWWDRLFEDPEFVDDLKNRWLSIREEKFTNEYLLSTIDSLANLLGEAQERNFVKWDIMGYPIWPEYHVSKSYEEEIERLKTWTTGRLQWLDSHLKDWTNIENRTIGTTSSVYPNPFGEHINYDFTLNSPAEVSLIIYDVNGIERSRIIDDAHLPAGTTNIEWNASALQSSIYVLVLKVNGEIVSVSKAVKL